MKDDMTDIVERLRAAMSQMDAYDRYSRQKLDEEAADEIERLLSVVIRLQAEKRELKKALNDRTPTGGTR